MNKKILGSIPSPAKRNREKEKFLRNYVLPSGGCVVSNGSLVVEPLPLHPKVKGLSSAAANCTERERK
jgi:hypothetical protein